MGYLHIIENNNMFTYENYLPLVAFNESSIFFQASEVFRYGFLLADISKDEEFKQLYSYHNYYIEVIFGENYEEIKHIEAITIDEAITKHLDVNLFDDALIDLFAKG